MLEGRDIVCVGTADWRTDSWTNQHHLMVRLARRNRVLFVESLGLRRPQLAGRDLRRMWRRLRAGLKPAQLHDGVHVLSPLVIPFHRSRAARAANARILPWLVGRQARKLGMHDPVLWAYAPQSELLIETLKPSLVLYHCVDDLAAQKGVDGDGVRSAEERIARRASVILASAPALVERMRTLSDRVVPAPNVADTALFATALEPGATDPAVAALPRPRAVFTGAIVATKLDVELIVTVARRLPQWSFAFVGAVGTGDPSSDVSALEAEPNIHLLGSRTYAELPAVLRGADVGVIPYAINDLTACVFPMKVYEYLAAGVPVVSTPLPALSGEDDIDFAGDPETFAKALQRALRGDSPARRAERSRGAARHSWDARLAEIAAVLETEEAQPA
jgi:glycosyltransferase involved in cell wall biosynthesis